MKVETRDNSAERRIIIGMITDDIIIARIASKWSLDGLFRSKWCNLIGQWCVTYFKKYLKSPGKSIEGIFETWASETRDKDLIALVDRFLGTISEEYENPTLKEDKNPDYLSDFAAKYFNEVAHRKLADGIIGFLDSGELSKAVALREKFQKIEMGTDAGIDLFSDKEAIQDAFAHRLEPLIEYDGPLGVFLGDELARDSFVAFMAIQKRGKSWVLQDLAWRGCTQRRRVAYFQVGDMSRRQIIKRFAVRAARAPLRPGVIKWPISITRRRGDDIADIVYKEYEYKKHLSWQAAWQGCQEVLRLDIRSKECKLRMSCHPTCSLTVSSLEGILQSWENDFDWSPDIIIIDYSDILKPDPHITDKREQINDIWMQLRALSQKRHCLVATATQAKISGYDAKVLKRSHFSEDSRKFSHVTAMVGINQTKEEKRLGLYRWNYLARREDDYDEDSCIHIASCLGLADPCVLSCF